MRLAAYVRVSSNEQRDEGTAETQRAEIRTWAKSAGHRIVSWHCDEGVSGTIAERLGLAECLEQPVDGIVVYKLDRLARDLMLQETLLNQVWKSGRQVFSTISAESDQLSDPTDPTRKLIRQVLGAIADYDRAITRARMVAGARRKKAAGGYGGGGIPFGYRANKLTHELEEDPMEQEALRLARRLKDKGESLRSIANALDGRGLRPRRASKWHPECVRQMVSS